MPRPFEDNEFDDALETESESESMGTLSTACPDCGAPLHDNADICPKCGMWVDGESVRVGTRRTRTMRQVSVIVVALLILALVLPLLRYF